MQPPSSHSNIYIYIYIYICICIYCSPCYLATAQPFDVRTDRKGCWSEHSMSLLQIGLSAEGTKNVSWPWLFPLKGWGSLTMAFTSKFVYITHHIVLIRLNDSDLRVYREGCWFEHSVSWVRACLSAEGAKNVPGTGNICSKDEVVWICHLLVNLYVLLTISLCYGSFLLILRLIERGVGLNTLCHSCGFPCQQRVLKTFPGRDNLRSEDEVVWLSHLMVNLYILRTISSCYGSILLTLRLIATDVGLTPLSHSRGSACHQRMLKTIHLPGCLCS